MQEKAGDDGRLQASPDACVATQNTTAHFIQNNGVQDGRKSGYSEDGKRTLSGNENKIINGDDSKVTRSENYSVLTRNQSGIRYDEENGTRYTKNKLWTNKVDGIARKTKPNPEIEDYEVIQPAESNVKAFFSSLLRFSLKRLYSGEETVANGCQQEVEEVEYESEEEEIKEHMGNLQSGDSKKCAAGKSPARDKKKGFLMKKPPAKDSKNVVKPVQPQFQVQPQQQQQQQQQQSVLTPGAERMEEEKVVPPRGVMGAEDSTVTGANGNAASVELESAERSDATMISDAKSFAPEFWKNFPELESAKEHLSLGLASVSKDSSSESIFLDPLSPRAFESEMNKTAESTGSSESKTTSTISAKDQEDYDDSTSLDDITLIDEQITEMDDSISNSFVQDERGKSVSFDVLEEPSSASLSRPTSFTLHKHKRVELGPITSPVVNAQTQEHLRRFSSVGEVPVDNNVLRKVASLTFDRNTIEQKVHKPKYLPEKLDFQLYEKFEGQQLINWFVSSFPEDHYLRMILAPQDLKILVAQFCTHMLAAGVVRQIPDKDAPLSSLFRPDLMYYWSHSEAPAATPATPGKLSGVWPQSFSSCSEGNWTTQNRPGVKYTEAENESPVDKEINLMTASTGSVDKAIRKIETEEFQQVVMGLKREHKDNITRLTRGQEVKLFKLRGEHAHILQEYEDRIKELEETVRKLTQELEKQKTIAEIQNLTKKVNSDFDSSTKTGNTPTKEESRRSSLRNSQTLEGPKHSSPNNTDNVKVNSPSQSPERVNALSNGSVKDRTFEHKIKVSPVSGTPEEDRVRDNGKVNSYIKGKEVTKEKESPGLSEEVSAENSKQPLQSEPQQQPPTPPPPPPPPPIPLMTKFVPIPPPPPPIPVEGAIRPLLPSPPPPPPFPGIYPTPPPLPPMGPTSGATVPPPPPPPMGPTSGATVPPPPPPPMGPTSGATVPPPPPPPMGPTSGATVPPPPPLLLSCPGMAPPPPPPVGASPMPFPAPPVGGWNAKRAELRKQPVNPAVPMKPLYWSRIIVPVSSCHDASSPTGTPTEALWEQLEEAKIEDYSEFNELFSRQIVTRKPTKKKTEEPSKQQAAKILDSKRSQNVGILSSSLHVDFSEIENAIYNFDTSVVNLEALQQIYEMRATEEELSQIRSHLSLNPSIPLDKPEQFLLELAEIPNFAERIACFMFQSEYEDNINTIESKLNNITSTCEMLLNAESVKIVMSIILALGNYMNGGNLTRGQADGFGIEILPKLRDVKSKDSSVTLLHFIVRTYMKKCDDPLNTDLALPVPEPGDINRAATVNFEEIKSDLQQLEKELNVCEKKTEKVINASGEENMQPFKDKMRSFLAASKKQIHGEFENLEECQMKFKATVRYYQYKPKTEFEVKEFFEIWAPFSKDFKDIWKKEQQRLIKEKLQEFKKKQDGRKQEIKPVKAGGLKDRMKQRLAHIKPS